MPTQYLTSKKTLTRDRARYEVHMLSDQITPSGTMQDAFGRMRVSEPFTLFDSQHRYEDNGKWNNVTTGTGSVTHIPNESCIDCYAPSGSSVIRETNLVFPYQPGKSLLILNSFSFSPSTVGIIQKLGYFSSQNGIYLLQDGHVDGPAFVLRSGLPGVPERIIRQKDWNGDKFDGENNYSLRNLDLTLSNIMWFDIEWLGVGACRCGFVVDGKFVVAHSFYNDNVTSTVYMTSAVLPLRLEVINEAGSSEVNGSIKQICNSVMSEGGYNPHSISYFQNSNVIGTPKTCTLDGTFYNAVSIRLAPNRLDGVIIPSTLSTLVESNKGYHWVLIKNPTYGTPLADWTTHPSCHTVQYSLTNTTVSGGTIILNGYLTSATGSIILSNIGDLSLQVGRTLGGVSDVYTLAIATDSANAKFTAGLGWNQII